MKHFHASLLRVFTETFHFEHLAYWRHKLKATAAVAVCVGTTKTPSYKCVTFLHTVSPLECRAVTTGTKCEPDYAIPGPMRIQRRTNLFATRRCLTTRQLVLLLCWSVQDEMGGHVPRKGRRWMQVWHPPGIGLNRLSRCDWEWVLVNSDHGSTEHEDFLD